MMGKDTGEGLLSWFLRENNILSYRKKTSFTSFF